jgi:hypothetical protein
MALSLTECVITANARTHTTGVGSDTNAPLGGTGGSGSSDSVGRNNGVVLPFAVAAHEDDRDHLLFHVSVSAPSTCE